MQSAFEERGEEKLHRLSPQTHPADRGRREAEAWRGAAPGFLLPTGPAKPAGSGTGIPDRFGRKPVETGQIQFFFFLFWFKFKCPQSILNECLYNMF